MQVGAKQAKQAMKTPPQLRATIISNELLWQKGAKMHAEVFQNAFYTFSLRGQASHKEHEKLSQRDNLRK